MNLVKALARLFGKFRSARAAQGLLAAQRATDQQHSPVDSKQDAESLEGEHGFPRHVSIIMDGNNRWAKNNAAAGVSGHRAGVEVIRDVLRGCERYGVEVLTLFAFSSENWLRPESEVNELMSLFEDYLDSEVGELHQQGIQLRFIGRRDRLKSSLIKKMKAAEDKTRANKNRVLVLAVDYGGRWDIAQASARAVREYVISANQVYDNKVDVLDNLPDDLVIDEAKFARHLALADLPEPDLCIRTGGEFRISNFLLWQCSYAELYFTECYWPDFNEHEFARAVLTYTGRQRRFGRTSEQLVASAGENSQAVSSGLSRDDVVVSSPRHA